jgi:hypothetical protein
MEASGRLFDGVSVGWTLVRIRLPNADQLNRRAEILRTAEQLVNNDRNTQYDEPSADFKRTAAIWSGYLGIPIEMHDVAAMMIGLKLARIRFAPEHDDSWIDAAGYAACGADVAPRKSNVTEPITRGQLFLDVIEVLDRHDVHLGAFIASDLDDWDHHELRDLWLMTRDVLAGE